jgi:hypothetical protein
MAGIWHVPRLYAELPARPSTQGHLTITFQLNTCIYGDIRVH